VEQGLKKEDKKESLNLFYKRLARIKYMITFALPKRTSLGKSRKILFR
jgi:hypothetical protein